MRSVRWRVSIIAAISAVIVLSPVIASSSGTNAVISGHVRDSVGVPVVGALVILAAANSTMPERMAWTDKRGFFSITNLIAGEYAIKVTGTRYLPVSKKRVRVGPGHVAVLTFSLQNALDVVRRAVSRDKAQAEDIMWTLRSARSTQPVLRHTQSGTSEAAPGLTPLDYTGYFQLYSKSVETSSGSHEGVGSEFSLTMPLDPRSQVTLAGQYSEGPTQPRGFGATYEFRRADRHRAEVGLNVRQGALIGDPLNVDALREIQLEYGENFQWSDHIVVNYGAEIGRADAMADRSYLRPRLAVSWVPESRTTVTVGATSQAPSTADDPIRGKAYFDRAAYIPPALENYSHAEITWSRVIGEDMDVSASLFRDRTDTQALFVSSPDGRHRVLILDSSKSPSEGIRLHLNRDFRAFQAGLGYTSTTGLAIAADSTSFRDVRRQVQPERFHVLTARVKADIDSTNTEITAVYRWMSSFSATRLDPYQHSVEYNDPSLSLTIAQSIPIARMVPAKVQAIVDARNVFEHAYGSKNMMQVAQYPRLLKGGINIRF